MYRLLIFLSFLFFVGCANTQSLKTGYAKVEGADLYYEERGNGPPLIVIHGGLLNHEMWDDQFEALAPYVRVIRYDVRGHGSSESSKENYTDHDDLYHLMKQLEIEKAAILGLSMGGRIAIDFAVKYPHKVSVLIPVAPGLSGFGFPDMASNENSKLLMESLSKGDLDGAVECFQRMWTDGPHRNPGQVDPEVREKVRAIAREEIQPKEEKGKSYTLNPPAIERLSKIDLPTLVIVGDLDMADINTITDLLFSQIKYSQKVVVHGTAHMVNMEQPWRFNQVVLDFLAKEKWILHVAQPAL